jgi:parvulin-like peptidyl-prolyl isomerase
MDEINITINGESVPFDAIKQEAERMRPHYDKMVRERNQTSSDDQLFEWAKENIVEATLLKQEAAKHFASELTDEDGKPKDPSQLVGKLIEEKCKDVTRPEEKELKEIYEKHKSQFVSPEQVHASHIVKHAKEPGEKTKAFMQMSEAKQAIDGGETFEAVAARMSDCPSNSGDLGVFPRGQMVQEFEDVVFAMQPEDISDVFLSDFGYHIAKLHKKLPPQQLQYAAVKAGIMEQMMNERKQLKLNAYVDGLKKNGEITEGTSS